jgi:hypothetical protein
MKTARRENFCEPATVTKPVWKFPCVHTDDLRVTTFFSLLLDHLVRHCGRIPGFALFGFFLSSALLLPCCYLKLISSQNALIEVASATAWMAAAGMVLLVFSGNQEEESGDN